MASGKDLASLGVVQQLIAARCPPESQTDVLLSCIDSGRPASEKVAWLLDVANGAPQLAAAALAAIVRTSRFNWLSGVADEEVLACLPTFAPQIGALLRKPGLVRDLHATMPYAAISLVMLVLRGSGSLSEEKYAQGFANLHAAAGHCLEIVAANLQHSPQQMEPNWQLIVVGMTARLAGARVSSLPAGSGKQLAAIVDYCNSRVIAQRTDSKPVPDEPAYASCPITWQMLAYRAQVSALVALADLQKVQPLTATTAASVLRAWNTLITAAARAGKPPDPDWPLLYSDLMSGALRSAPRESVDAALLCICDALQAHTLPDPSSHPGDQVMADLIDVSELLAMHAGQLGVCLEQPADDRLGSRLNGESCSASSAGTYISKLHAPPLRSRWQSALRAALQPALLWLKHLPAGVHFADRLFIAASRLALPAAAVLKEAAEGADAAAALAQPSAVALAEVLQGFLDVQLDHIRYALRRSHSRPHGADFVMVSFRAVAATFRAWASAAAQATAAAEAAGQPPPAEALYIGCSAPAMQLRHAASEHECALVQGHSWSRGQRCDVMSLMLMAALVVELHGSGAAARSMLDQHNMAACMTTVVHMVASPDMSPFGALHETTLPALQAACKALEMLVAGSRAAKQQCMGTSRAGGLAWPRVAALVRQELRRLPARLRLLGEKALQQVEQVLQGGQQAGPPCKVRGTAAMPQRSQADADLAMQRLLEEEEAEKRKHKQPSKAAQKRARKKASVQQSAGAAAAAAATAASAPDKSQPQTPQALPAASQTRTVEPGSSAAAAEMQQLILDAPAAVTASSATAEPAGQQSADDWMMCPLSKVVMEDPVMCSDGYTYSRAAITAWLDGHDAISPMTTQPLARRELIPNHALRNTIEAVRQRTA